MSNTSPAGSLPGHGVRSVHWHAGRQSTASPPPPGGLALLFAYYLGSSIFGSVSGRAWTVGGWRAVVLLAGVLVAATGLLSLALRRTPSLDPLLR